MYIQRTHRAIMRSGWTRTSVSYETVVSALPIEPRIELGISRNSPCAYLKLLMFGNTERERIEFLMKEFVRVRVLVK